jgi:hypothetical protein
MRWSIILFASMTGAVLASAAGWSASPPVFKSVTVEFPPGVEMFTGPGSDAANNNCLACHSADMVLNQPALTKQAWEAEVTKMVNVYKAPVSAADAAAVVDYLARTKGAR